MADQELLDANPTNIKRKCGKESSYRTSLTRKIRAFIGEDGLLANEPNYSWENMEGGSPLPAVLTQERDLCICNALCGLLKCQINLLRRLDANGNQHDQPQAPQLNVSLPFLVNLFESLEKEEEKTIDTLLVKLHKEGFVNPQGYSKENEAPRPGAQRYFVHFSWGFGLETEEEDPSFNFDIHLKRCLKNNGPMLAEMLMTDDFDDEGVEVATASGVRKTDMLGNSAADSGHAIIIVGWRFNAGRVEYRYLSSYGPNFGENGYHWLTREAIYFVYCVQVLQWFGF